MLKLRPVSSGLHAVADVIDVEAEALCDAAAERGIEVMPLSGYFLSKRTDANGLVLGFASNRPESLMKAMAQLGQAGEVARQRQRSRSALRVRARG